jgi:YrbI family 3-deoxy-D-manno-octulosonate 8-phosphate phosphatase
MDRFAQLIPQICLVGFDFDGVFTDNAVYVFEDGSEAVRCRRGDSIGLQKLTHLGIHTAIISTETNPVVSARNRKLGIRCVQGCSDKSIAFEAIVREFDLSLSQVAFMGNDINDLPYFTCVRLPIVVWDAYPDVLADSASRLKASGDYGAVSEVCGLFERVLMSGS